MLVAYVSLLMLGLAPEEALEDFSLLRTAVSVGIRDGWKKNRMADCPAVMYMW